MDKRRTQGKAENSPRPFFRDESKKSTEKKMNLAERLMRLLREGIDRGFVYHED